MPRLPSEEELLQNATETKQEATPAVTPLIPSPSFVLMDVQDIHIVFYIYKLVQGEVKVEKLDFTKKLFDN